MTLFLGSSKNNILRMFTWVGDKIHSNALPGIFAKFLFKVLTEKSMSLTTEKKKKSSANNFRFDARLSDNIVNAFLKE